MWIWFYNYRLRFNAGKSKKSSKYLASFSYLCLTGVILYERLMDCFNGILIFISIIDYVKR